MAGEYLTLRDPEVRKGLRLLCKYPEKALKGLGKHEAENCPIHCAFEIKAHGYWVDLSEKDRKTLKKVGFIESVYDKIIEYYDTSHFGAKFTETYVKEEVFRRYLEKALTKKKSQELKNTGSYIIEFIRL